MTRFLARMLLLLALLAPVAALALTPPPSRGGGGGGGVVPAIPEPASIAVFAAGALLVLGSLRRARR